MSEVKGKLVTCNRCGKPISKNSLRMFLQMAVIVLMIAMKISRTNGYMNLNSAIYVMLALKSSGIGLPHS